MTDPDLRFKIRSDALEGLQVVLDASRRRPLVSILNRQIESYLLHAAAGERSPDSVLRAKRRVFQLAPSPRCTH